MAELKQCKPMSNKKWFAKIQVNEKNNFSDYCISTQLFKL